MGVAGSTGAGGLGAAGITGAGGGASSFVGVRFAHLAPNVPAVDICYRPLASVATNGPYTGPVLAPMGGSAGISYGQVSGFFPLMKGQWDYVLVPAGSGDCSNKIPGHPFSAGFGFNGAPFGTVMILTPMMGMDAFTGDTLADDHAQQQGNFVYLRFANYYRNDAPPMSLDLVATAGGATTTLFQGVGRGNPAKTFPPLQGATLEVRQTGATDALVSALDVTLPADSVRVLFVMGDAAGPPRLVMCEYTEAYTYLSVCTTY
jgi:hypothetical protein